MLLHCIYCILYLASTCLLVDFSLHTLRLSCGWPASLADQYVYDILFTSSLWKMYQCVYIILFFFTQLVFAWMTWNVLHWLLRCFGHWGLSVAEPRQRNVLLFLLLLFLALLTIRLSIFWEAPTSKPLLHREKGNSHFFSWQIFFLSPSISRAAWGYSVICFFFRVLLSRSTLCL